LWLVGSPSIDTPTRDRETASKRSLFAFELSQAHPCMVRFKVWLSRPTVFLPSTIEHAFIKQNRWLLIEFIPAASSSPPPSTSVSTPGHHGPIQYITTLSPDAISGRDVFNALKQSVLLNFGDVGWGQVGSSLAGEIISFLPPSLLLMFRSFPFLLTAEQSKVFLPYDEPLHRTCRAGRGDKHDLGSARIAGQSGRGWRG
jgi:hypothetical protein